VLCGIATTGTTIARRWRTDGVFLNTYAAYDDQSLDEQRFFNGLRVVHSRVATMSRVRPDVTEEETTTWRRTPTTRQPLVWQPDSGRKSLMLGNSVAYNEGMYPADSNNVLTQLRLTS
jgi:alpha-ketoglutarate-dependent taurine dioxygenase